MTENLNQPHRWKSSLVAGLIAGAAALIVITGILTAAVASSDANRKLGEVTAQLDDAATSLEQTSAELDAFRRQQTARTEASSARGRRLLAQADQLRRQLNALTKMLREQGIEVPPPSPPPEPSPKAEPGSGPGPSPRPPRPSAPGSPEPTSPNPASPRPDDLTCQLLPAICSGLPTSVPPLLP